MNLNKHAIYFDPSKVTQSLHIIGVGAIGSNLAIILTRLGFERIHLYDFDVVSEHNLTNQAFIHADIGSPKCSLVAKKLKAINPEINPIVHENGWTPNTPLSGYVFLCVDNIELRKEITKENFYNPQIKAIFDIRMDLTDAQHYACKWIEKKDKEGFLNTMNFTKEEAEANTPVSPCGTTLNVLPTVLTVCSACVANFMNMCKTGQYKKLILTDTFTHSTDAY